MIGLTIGELKELIKDLPDDMEVLHRFHEIRSAKVKEVRINFKRNIVLQLSDEEEDD